MSPRDSDLAKLAGLCGWTWLPPNAFGVPHGSRGSLEPLYIPAPDATLPEQMAFVGRLAVALGCRYPRLTQGPHGWLVNLSDDTGAEGYDLAWAACRAAIAARQGGTDGHS